MTTKTWNGTTDYYLNGSDWSPPGVPQPGDSAIINGGMPIVANITLSGMSVQLNGASGQAPAIEFLNAIIDRNTHIGGTSTARLLDAPITLNMVGTTANNGIVTMFGTAGSRYTINVNGATSGTAGTLVSTGSFDAVNASPAFQYNISGAVGTLENDGMVSVWNPANTVLSATIGLNLTGSGVVQIDPDASVGLGQLVASSQLIDFAGGAGAGSLLEISHPASFQGVINGFAQSDTIGLGQTPYDGYVYTNSTANSGLLHMFYQGVDKADLSFNGVYSTSSFSASGLGGGSGEVDLTTTAQPAQPISFTNAVINQSSTDAGVAYTGPVAGVQTQYLWSGPDAAAISAKTPNVFLKGGSGDDALSVLSGTNVLDGGAGSNFLVGSTDPNSVDTFFVDGRGQGVTWGTIVNFHFGDQATIFGFNNGTSTLPFTNSDGAAGYTGFTIHSELNGPGTGVDASMTFTGIDQAAATAHFTFTTGTVGGNVSYLLIQYNK